MSEPSNISPDHDVTLAILAGGMGERMGRPKGLLRIAGEPILSYLLDRLNWPGPSILVMSPGRETPEGADRFDRVSWDEVAGQGPLQGLLTACEAATTALLVAIPVDMVNVESGSILELAHALGKRADQAALCFSRSNRMEPMPIAMRPSIALPVLRRRLAENRRAIRGLLDEPTISMIEAPPDLPETFWTNLNTPEDLRKFHSRAGAPDPMIQRQRTRT